MRHLVMMGFLAVAAPALAETVWDIDPAHTSVQFSIRHMMISNVRGEFSKVAGTVRGDQADPTRAQVEATIDTSSLDTREAKRDEQNQVLQKKIADYDAFVQKNWGPKGSVSQLNEQFLKPIVDRVHKIVTTFGSDEGYSIILDAADGNIIFGDKALDLTDRVLEQLRKEDSNGLPQPTGSAPPAPTGGN